MTPADVPEEATGGRQRLDKYLWFARVVKTRTRAAKLVSSGKVRVNLERVTNPAKAVVPGDILTISLERTIRVLKVLAPGTRRGPFEEARLLYEEMLDNEPPPRQAVDFAGPEHARTRPDKRSRRIAAQLKRNVIG